MLRLKLLSVFSSVYMTCAILGTIKLLILSLETMKAVSRHDCMLKLASCFAMIIVALPFAVVGLNTRQNGHRMRPLIGCNLLIVFFPVTIHSVRLLGLL
jgi:hypothetical protein